MPKRVAAVAKAIYRKPVMFGPWLLSLVTITIAAVLFQFQLGGLLEDRQSAAEERQAAQEYSSQLFDYNQCLARVDSRHVIRSLFIEIASLPEVPEGSRSSFVQRMDATYPELSPDECVAPKPPS